MKTALLLALTTLLFSSFPTEASTIYVDAGATASNNAVWRLDVGADLRVPNGDRRIAAGFADSGYACDGAHSHAEDRL